MRAVTASSIERDHRALQHRGRCAIGHQLPQRGCGGDDLDHGDAAAESGAAALGAAGAGRVAAARRAHAPEEMLGDHPVQRGRDARAAESELA
jgi:hypothetical protein